MTQTRNTAAEGIGLLHVFEEALTFWVQIKTKLIKEGLNLRDDQGNLVQVPLEYLHNTLVVFFEQQRKSIKAASPTSTHEQYDLVLYALMALIDDQLLNSPQNLLKDTPNEAKSWLDYLLEEHFFGSAMAGHKVIDNIENLIQNSKKFDTPLREDAELAYVYLCIIWKGFKGKLYSEANNARLLNQIKPKLINLCKHTSLQVENATPPLMTQYWGASVLNASPDKSLGFARLAPIARWNKIVVATLFITFLVSTGLWYGLTYSLNKKLNETISEQQSARSTSSTPQKPRNMEHPL